MTKKELIDAAAESAGTTKKMAEQIISAAFETMADTISAGEEVSIYGFGAFKITEREARMGRNPKTGESIKIAASKGVRFKATKAIKDSLKA